MFNFCREVGAILRQTGWTPDRSVEISQWTDPLEKEGYTYHAAAERILRNLGGVRIIPPPRQGNLFFPSEILLDPFYAASAEFDRVKAWQEKFSLTLSPLGEYDPLYLLLCADDGKIYGGREKKFYLLGGSIEEALELRILAMRLPILMQPA